MAVGRADFQKIIDEIVLNAKKSVLIFKENELFPKKY